MNHEVVDEIIDEIIKNDGRDPVLASREATWSSWVPEIARKTPAEALACLGSGWGGLAQSSAEERLRTWGPNHLPQGGLRKGLLGRVIQSLVPGAPARTCVIRRRGRGDQGARPLWVSPDQLTPGDLLLLSAGETVPADVRLLRVREFRVDERILTGSRRPVAKAARWEHTGTGPSAIRDLAYGGTRVVTGTATGVVMATGDCMLVAILRSSPGR